MKETMKQKIERLEKEVTELRKQLHESWAREQQQIKEIIKLKDGLEERFKETPLYIQMQRDLGNLKAENALNKRYISTLEEIRGKQAEMILELKKNERAN